MNDNVRTFGHLQKKRKFRKEKHLNLKLAQVFKNIHELVQKQFFYSLLKMKKNNEKLIFVIYYLHILTI